MIEYLIQNKTIQPPKYIGPICYEVNMGSHAYGVATIDSDMDIYSFSLPDKEIIFPEKYAGVIYGFDSQYEKFDQFQAHHLEFEGKELDLTIYSIIRYVKLCMDNNPNLLDSLFVDESDILYINKIGKIIRDNRHYFLSKLCYHRYKGYSWAQFEKLKNKAPSTSRKELVDKYGVDTKFLYHTYRLISQAKQILTEHDLYLKDPSRIAMMRKIRAGEFSFESIESWFKDQQLELEELYNKSTLRYSPDKDKIKEVLLECLN